MIFEIMLSQFEVRSLSNRMQITAQDTAHDFLHLERTKKS